jgi:hypothetical protein
VFADLDMLKRGNAVALIKDVNGFHDRSLFRRTEGRHDSRRLLLQG